MVRVKGFDLEITLAILEELGNIDLTSFSFTDLEWILADFVLSYGQRLQIHSTSWPPQIERERAHDYGQRYLPFSTASDFSNVSINQVRSLGLATATYGLYILLLDEIIDAIDPPDTASVASKLALQHLLLFSQERFRILFSPESNFWSQAEQRALVTTRAMWNEYYNHNKTIRPFTLAKFRCLAIDKVAIAQINPIGLAILNGTPELIPNLIQCWDIMGLAATILDDIHDWQQDYEAANYTYLLSSVLLSAPLQASVAAGQLPPVQTVGTALFCSETIESLYNLASVELDSAASHAHRIGCPALATLLQKFLALTQSQADNYVQRKLIALLTAV